MVSYQLLDSHPVNSVPNTFQLAQAEYGTWLGSATDFYNASLQHDGFNQSRFMGFSLNSPSTKYVNQHQLPQGALPRENNNHTCSRFSKSDGNTSFSPMRTSLLTKEFITSPEQISSVTACSEADLFSESEHLDSGSNFSSPDFDYLSQSSAETYTPRQPVTPREFVSVNRREILEIDQIPSYGCLPKPFIDNMDLCHSNAFILGKIPERRLNSLSSVISGVPRHGDQSQLLPNTCSLEQISKRIPQRRNSLSSMVAGKVIPRLEDQYQIPQFHDLLNRYELDELSTPRCGELSPGKHSENSIDQHNGSSASMVDDFPPPPKRARTGDYVHFSLIASSDDQCRFEKTLDDSGHEGSPCYGQKEQAELSTPRCRQSSSGKQSGNSTHQHNGSTTSMVDDSPPPPKCLRTGDSVHYSLIGSSDDQCRFDRSLDNSQHEDSQKEVVRIQQVFCPETYIESKKKEEFQEVLNQAVTTEQSLPCEDILKSSDGINYISDETERLGCQNPSLFKELDNGSENVLHSTSDNTAVQEQQNVVEEYASKCEEQPKFGIKCLSKPQEQPKIIQEPGVMQCNSNLPQLESKGEMDSRECEKSDQLRTGSEDSGKLPVSYIDFFNSEQIKEHISSLKSSSGQPSGTRTKETPKENWLCRLCCSTEKLLFGPPPLYCSRCCNLVKPNSVYYSAQDDMGSRHFFCPVCFKLSRGSSILFQGHSFSKAQMWKERNNMENEESWVQCDKCEHWMHQICGLFNAKRDPEGKAKYACPYCRLEEIELGKHVPSSATFGAKDLPRTGLSDHIEERLFRLLKREREERAKVSNKDINEVPGVGELVVRVVSSVSKILKVNPEFLNIIPEQDYPKEFPYKSKVILLFQKIEGIDVCLFCMYVQEYGSECDKPNQRSVYISYLDSIKYFRPEIHTVSGEALRTFIYHEILIGYLEYCKKRGFVACYVWACPPYRKEDYIFNCHPDSQKIPKQDKLRQWYKSMLKKAMKDEVVVDYKTFYESFFIQNEECNNKITAARLPYFDGDYWSDAAEDMIRKMQKEDGGETEGKVKKPVTKRIMKSMGHMDLNIDATKDILVMQKISHAMLTTRENFLVVQLLFTCKNCQNPILSGFHWFCNQCKTSVFCSRCHEKDPNFKESSMHTSIGGEEHLLSKVVINDLPADTAEEDGLLKNHIFENRHSFLGFCQGNNYQFNTLRRAKHSSMMILYDLRKQMWIIRKMACRICQKEIMVQAHWHSEIRPELDVCDKCCYKVRTDDCNPKSVVNIPKADCGLLRYEALPETANQVRYRNVVEHASQCFPDQSNPCLHPDCSKVKKFFRHSRQCKKNLVGRCENCRKIWIMICIHAVRCKDSNCQVPRCRDARRHIEECSERSCRFCYDWRRFVARCK
ncbi:OLC1v1009943C4 [Oldenlandia corymbosa var. corymbosa]|nr:OLC1v1009943C4 [Oldenlandia corymbosa var. corymbosa]